MSLICVFEHMPLLVPILGPLQWQEQWIDLKNIVGDWVQKSRGDEKFNSISEIVVIKNKYYSYFMDYVIRRSIAWRQWVWWNCLLAKAWERRDSFYCFIGSRYPECYSLIIGLHHPQFGSTLGAGRFLSPVYPSPGYGWLYKLVLRLLGTCLSKPQAHKKISLLCHPPNNNCHSNADDPPNTDNVPVIPIIEMPIKLYNPGRPVTGKREKN